MRDYTMSPRHLRELFHASVRHPSHRRIAAHCSGLGRRESWVRCLLFGCTCATWFEVEVEAIGVSDIFSARGVGLLRLPTIRALRQGRLVAWTALMHQGLEPELARRRSMGLTPKHDVTSRIVWCSRILPTEPSQLRD